MPKLVAIHQPNFFPWLGYFDKLARADIFIVLDHVQLPKTGGTWSNRVQLLVNREPRWATMPVQRDHHGVLPINQALINDGQPWRRNFLGTLRANYSKTTGFAPLVSIVEKLVFHPESNLAAFNLHTLQQLCPLFGIDPGKLVLSSTLQPSTSSTDLLIDLTRAVGGTAYLCGAGSDDYLEPNKFHSAGIELVYQNFQHPIYSQLGLTRFVPGLSCLDALFQCGITAVSGWFQPRSAAA